VASSRADEVIEYVGRVLHKTKQLAGSKTLGPRKSFDPLYGLA